MNEVEFETWARWHQSHIGNTAFLPWLMDDPVRWQCKLDVFRSVALKTAQDATKRLVRRQGFKELKFERQVDAVAQAVSGPAYDRAPPQGNRKQPKPPATDAQVRSWANLILGHAQPQLAFESIMTNRYRMTDRQVGWIEDALKERRAKK